MWLDLGEYRGPSRIHSFVMYSAARRRERMVRDAYRSYVCDSLQMAPQGKYITQRFADSIRPRKDIDVDAVIDHVASLIGED